MSNTWFTSDCHFSHENIIKYCNRPFKNAEEMDKRIIDKWNTRVKHDDVVYHIGDFCFKNKDGRHDTSRALEFEHKLNGKIIHIKGNHDKNSGVRSAMLCAMLEFGKKQFFLTHVPPENLYGIPDYCDAVLCGHVHEKWKYQILTFPEKANRSIPLINVGMDVWNFFPVSKRDILEYLDKIK